MNEVADADVPRVVFYLMNERNSDYESAWHAERDSSSRGILDKAAR